MAYQQPIDQPLPMGSAPPPSYGAAANDNIQPIPVQQQQQNITYVDEKGQPLPQQPQQQQQQPQFMPAQQQPIQMQQMPVGQPQFIPQQQQQLQPQQMVIMTPQGPMLVQGASQGAMMVGPDGKTMTTTTVMATVQPQTMPMQQQMPQQHVANTTTVIQTGGGSNAGAAAAGAAGGAAGGFCGACCGQEPGGAAHLGQDQDHYYGHHRPQGRNKRFLCPPLYDFILLIQLLNTGAGLVGRGYATVGLLRR
ncbi:hypothetical protein V8F06_006236 [Rhypophila decipiens]